MAAQLKNFFSRSLIEELAAEMTRAHPPFPSRRFAKDAGAGLAQLELLERGKHIAAVLARYLPPDYPSAIDVLLRSLGPEHKTDELVGAGMAPFRYLPHTLFVATYGLEHFDLSMKAQYELTKRFTAEGSIRPFLAREPERTFEVLSLWAGDPNAHVRRLVSEGTRLRLPWAMRVEWLDRNPRRVLRLLEVLKDDPSSLVRRSVANNLNDLGKVHPAMLIDTCQRWLRDASAQRRAMIEHALRSAIKRGVPGALKLLGFGKKASVTLERAAFAPQKCRIGGKVAVSFVLWSRESSEQRLLVDLRVHFVKANGKASPKVFKLKRVSLRQGQRAEFSKTISLAVHTTRKPQPGRHDVEVLVNGVAIRLGFFEVT